MLASGTCGNTWVWGSMNQVEAWTRWWQSAHNANSQQVSFLFYGPLWNRGLLFARWYSDSEIIVVDMIVVGAVSARSIVVWGVDSIVDCWLDWGRCCSDWNPCVVAAITFLRRMPSWSHLCQKTLRHGFLETEMRLQRFIWEYGSDYEPVASESRKCLFLCVPASWLPKHRHHVLPNIRGHMVRLKYLRCCIPRDCQVWPNMFIIEWTCGPSTAAVSWRCAQWVTFVTVLPYWRQVVVLSHHDFLVVRPLCLVKTIGLIYRSGRICVYFNKYEMPMALVPCLSLFPWTKGIYISGCRKGRCRRGACTVTIRGYLVSVPLSASNDVFIPSIFGNYYEWYRVVWRWLLWLCSAKWRWVLHPPISWRITRWWGCDEQHPSLLVEH
jgi:hypothetical protein